MSFAFFLLLTISLLLINIPPPLTVEHSDSNNTRKNNSNNTTATQQQRQQQQQQQQQHNGNTTAFFSSQGAESFFVALSRLENPRRIFFRWQHSRLWADFAFHPRTFLRFAHQLQDISVSLAINRCSAAQLVFCQWLFSSIERKTVLSIDNWAAFYDGFHLGC